MEANWYACMVVILPALRRIPWKNKLRVEVWLHASGKSGDNAPVLFFSSTSSAIPSYPPPNFPHSFLTPSFSFFFSSCSPASASPSSSLDPHSLPSHPSLLPYLPLCLAFSNSPPGFLPLLSTTSPLHTYVSLYLSNHLPATMLLQSWETKRKMVSCRADWSSSDTWRQTVGERHGHLKSSGGAIISTPCTVQYILLSFSLPSLSFHLSLSLPLSLYSRHAAFSRWSNSFAAATSQPFSPRQPSISYWSLHQGRREGVEWELCWHREGGNKYIFVL